MTDTAALKNRIRAAIKANDNQEITGPVLQQALLDMVDELNGATETEAAARQNGDSTLSGMINSETQRAEGAEQTLQNNLTQATSQLQTAILNLRNAGYAFGGIAVTGMNPGVPSGNCFYIVRGAGTYTYFKDADNESIVFENDGIYVLTYESVENNYWEWNKIISIDSELTAGSDNLIKSGVVQNEFALGAVYDVSAKNPAAGPNNDGKWESLSALLSDANIDTLIPTTVRNGGMSIKFASDNKYLQYRYTGTDITGTPNPFLDIRNWEGREIMTTPSYTELNGLLDNTGSIVSGTRYYHTSPIEVKAGQCLVVKNAIQVNSSICSIALVEDDGTFIMPIYQYGVHGKWEYVFTPVEDCYVSISYYTPANADDKIVGIVSSNDAYEKKLATLKNWLYTESYAIRSGTVVRDSDGNVTSSDIFYPDKTLGHVSVTRDTNFNVTQLLFTYLNENITMTISRDANGYVTGTNITI